MNMITILSLLLLAIVLAALKLLPRLLAGVPFISPANLKAWIDRGEEILVLDVRTPAEFTGSFGHVPGSFNLSLDELRGRLDDVKDRLEPFRAVPVFLICLSANRAARAAPLLKRAGLVNIRVVDGGMIRWVRMGLPTAHERSGAQMK